jgi:hypothetical protein
MNTEGKKINLDFRRLSARQASEMSSNTVGDIGPATILVSNQVSNDEGVPGLGIMNMLGEISKMTRQSIKITTAIVGDDLAFQTPKSSIWKRVRNAVGLNP